MQSHTELQGSQLRRAALEHCFQKMNDMQKRAVFQIDGPLLILAGAGSGKTTVLIGRIENMVRFGGAYHSPLPFSPTEADTALLHSYLDGADVDPDRLGSILSQDPIRPWNILAITFTNKAAGELKTRLEERLGETGRDVHASTFHSLCVRILRREIEAIGYGRNFTIYDTDDSLRVIKEGLKACRVDDKVLPARSVLSAISKAKDGMTTPADMLASAGADYRLGCVGKVYEFYQTSLKAANALDFDDIITLTVQLLGQHPQILEYYQNRYRYIMVDEYQDTNQTQYRLISMLAARHQNLCVVGDDDQSIYKFRGATIENILSFESQFDSATVIRLEQNYRSTQNILSAANRVIENNTARKGKNLWTSAGDGDKLRMVRTRDELEESRLIADTILDRVQEGGGFSQHAVLYRMNAQSNTVEKALAQRAIPYRIVGGLRFYERKEIKDMVAYLSVLENPGDTLRLLRIINEPKRGIGASTLTAAQEIATLTGETLFHVITHADEFAPLAKKSSSLQSFGHMMESLTELAESAPLDELLDELLEQTGYLHMLEAQGFEGAGRIENIMELKSNLVKYQEESDEPTLGGFLEEIALYTDLDNYDAGADAVVLMTVHSAKGLEFDHVYVAGMDEGIFPGRAALSNPGEIEEERRLAYVAITRARRTVTITSAEKRLIFGQTTWNRPSRFVGEIPGELLDYEDRVLARKEAAAQAPAPKGRQKAASHTSIGVGAAAGTPAQPGATDFAAGERVSHRVFGEGTVLSTRPMGGDLLMEIDFSGAGVKKLMANFARLTKLS